MAQTNMEVLITSDDCPRSAIEMLQKHFKVTELRFSGYTSDNALYTQEVMSHIPGVSAIMWCSKHPITAELLDAADGELKIVATPSAGYNHCNVSELGARNIQLSNTPNVLSAAVAEVAVMLLLGVTRRLNENLSQVRKGTWEVGFQATLGMDIRGSTLGIIGFGGIGQTVAKRLAAFEVDNIIYSGHNEKPEGKALKATFVPLDQLLKESDIILLSCPLTDETREIINKNNLAKMKSNAIIINVGRGDLINQEALYAAIKNKNIYGAGLDVTTPEPLPISHPLLTLPTVFVLPHIGSATIKTRTDMAELAANNIINSLYEKPLLTPILP